MAASALLERGEITEVYYRFGKFYNDQRPRFIQAPFDIVKLNGEEYVQPLPIGGNAAELNGVINSNTIATEQYMGRRDFGCVNLDPIVTDENEWGGWKKDGLRGLHFFDLI